MERAIPKAVIFDIGHVLVDWDMRLLLRKLTSDPAEVERLATQVITPEWHFQHDAGRPLADMLAERAAQFPGDGRYLHAYATRFVETIPGPIPGMVALVEELAAAGVPLFAITNFGEEFWALFRPTFPLLDLFHDIVVSGAERLVKPDAAIYRLALKRFGLAASDALFIDDRAENVAGAEAVGIAGHVFSGADGLRAWLSGHGVIAVSRGNKRYRYSAAIRSA